MIAEKQNLKFMSREIRHFTCLARAFLVEDQTRFLHNQRMLRIFSF